MRVCLDSEHREGLDMKIRMDIKGQQALRDLLAGRAKQADKAIRIALVRICVRWELEAKRRIPVETGFARNSVTHEVGKDADGHFGAVGSNADYAKYLEFGTEHIAGGAVKALGTREDVTDAQAIKIWPAKNANLLKKDGTANAAFTRLTAKVAAGGAQEQMPWLRTSFMSIRIWALDELAKAIKWED